ncbi:MAG: ATP-binding protein [Salegentibacter sp.]
MKLSKKQEREILQVYDTWLHSYLNGDVNTYAAYLDTNYHFIGSTSNEEFLSKQDTTAFFKSTADQLTGKTAIRNSVRTLQQIGELVFLTDLFDAWFLNAEEWTFYGRFRFTSALQKKEAGWRFVYQHFSTPDEKAQEDETIGYEKISEENLQLREAIKRRTKELEERNREAQIEAALEKVRSKTMAMHSSQDMEITVKTLFEEVSKLVLDKSIRCGIGILNKDTDFMETYSATSKPDGAVDLRMGMLNMKDHPMLVEIRKSWKEGKSDFQYHFDKKSLFIYYKALNDAPDYHFERNLDTLPEEEYQRGFFFNEGILFAFASESFSEESVTILNRFAKVFEQTYTRFLDLQKAEAQAREAQIEAALERVRSRTMAMYKTPEIQEVVNTVHNELLHLNISVYGGSFIAVNKDITDEIRCWGSGGTATTSEEIVIPHFDMPFCTNLMDGIKGGAGFFTEEFSQKEKQQFFSKLFKYEPWSGISSEEKKKTLSSPGGYTRSVVVSKHTTIFTINHTGRKFTDAENEVLKRFGKVFEQTYTRFLDLQKAESQAREAEIELALERVRARAMAMQESEELAEVSSLMFKQLKLLKIDTYSSGFTIWEEENKELNSWMCNADGSMNPPFHMPMTQDSWHKEQYEAWNRGEEFLIKDFRGEEMKAHFRYLRSFPLLDEAFKKSIAAGHSMPERQIHHVANFSHGNLLFITLKPRPEAHEIFRRFAKVFEQTYTRFLDLKKAEAQAKEASIQLALERVRAKTMAMQSSEELADVAFILFEQLRGLGGNLWGTGFGLCEKGSDKDSFWFANEYGVFPPVSIPHTTDPAHQQMFDGWKAGKELLTIEASGKDLKSHYDYMLSLPEVKPFFQKILDEGLSFPKWQQWNAAYFKHGYLLIITLEPYRNPEVLARFAKVFEQTYTRFLDLKKAEAQAREAQVNLAVERVRAKALAMFKSEEILEVVYKLKEEIMGLNIPNVTAATIHLKEPDGRYRAWDLTSIEGEGKDFEISLDICYNIEETHPDFFMREVWSRTEDYFVVIQSGDRFKHTARWLERNGYSEQAKEFEEFLESSQLERAYHPTVLLNNGRMSIDLLNPPAPEVESILKKMAGAFDLAYKRFEDLQKAEAQAREAQIEAALERVRSRSMGMQKSEELADLSLELVKQVQNLGVSTWFCAFNIYDDDPQGSLEWGSNGQGTFPKYRTPREGIFLKYYEAGQKGKKLLINEINEDECPAHYEYLCSLPGVGDQLLKMKAGGISFPTSQIDHVAYFKYGYIIFITYEPVPEAYAIFKRFAKVFEQTYTRFLDLKKAEGQAREAKIEAALERIRSRTMGMQSSDELPEVANLLFLEVQDLGIPAWSCGYNILNDDKKTATAWMSSEGTLQEPFKLRLFGEASFDEWEGFFLSDEPMLVQELGGKALEKHYEHMKSFPDLRPTFDKIEKQGLSLPTYQINHLCKFSHGFLLFITYEPVPDAHDVFKRFTKVFDQTYTRFLDLQKAEAREKEAIKQASLDRVRGEIASMRTIKDLEHITPVIWKELTVLGVPFFRCGVFIIREDEEMVHAYLSKPDGTSVAAIHIPFDDKDNRLIEPMIKNWRMQKTFHEEWDRKLFIQQTRIFVDKGQIENPESYPIVNTPPENLVLNLVPFKQGMIYIGHQEDLTKDQISLVESLSKAFSVAYSRYEDFRALENTKNSLELTIKDLQSTQAQLIQAEKMASLGELTAGIAHEIKNPLNFVNNFSEVSKELLDEMNEELRNGNYELVAEIAGDVNENMGKILHHGKRADEIVKGMLQHSRSNSGKKEEINVNAFVDEYLRLAYHGLRAKDKSFNAKMKTDFDPESGKIEVIPQELGRVILNLVTNAFYAVSERSKILRQAREDNDYDPTVYIVTGRIKDQIEIIVRDNGMGIPEEIRDKIFQPFFTTKPTGEGTGLGLSLSYDIVKAHGGEMKMESSRGKNPFTKFIIQLPTKT